MAMALSASQSVRPGGPAPSHTAPSNTRLPPVHAFPSFSFGKGQPTGKVVHLMRHGVTEMNVYLRRVGYNSPGFKDPLYYDTVLTEDGKAGAVAASEAARNLAPHPELLVVSPLTRTLQTAELAFPNYSGPLLVEPLVRERVYLSSDVGSVPQRLQEAWAGGRYDGQFAELPEIWWYNGGSRDPATIKLEPESVFQQRIRQLKQWLLARPEKSIAVVSHWGVIRGLTGLEFNNCQIGTFEISSTGHFKPIKEDVFASLYL